MQKTNSKNYFSDPIQSSIWIPQAGPIRPILSTLKITSLHPQFMEMWMEHETLSSSSGSSGSGSKLFVET